MAFVYVIESITTKRWYYGSTDPDQRLIVHNKGWNRSTRGRGPWKYVFLRKFETEEKAREFEKYLKLSKNKTFIRQKFAEFFI